MKTLEEMIDSFSERLERSARMTPKGNVRTALMNAATALVKSSTAIVTAEVEAMRKEKPKKGKPGNPMSLILGGHSSGKTYDSPGAISTPF